MITFHKHLSKNIKQLRSISCSCVLTSKNDKDDEKDDKKLSKEEATAKLNDLLNFMIQKESNPPAVETDVKLAAKTARLKIEKPEKEKSLGEKLAGAAKDVAKSLGGDAEKTESELLNILLRKSEPNTLQDVLTGIKVDESESRARQVRDSLAKQRFMGPSSMEKRGPKSKGATRVNILGATPSSYFKDLQPQPAACHLRTWQSCVDKDLRLAVTHPPSNIYEQMSLWTDRGMFWHFPIDNEQGLDAEKQVSFEEHIFLENHLEGWCPDEGPIRFFMELVCIGLSKNHWLSAEEKKIHIMWFRDYFADKKTLIKELGAGTINIETNEQKETYNV